MIAAHSKLGVVILLLVLLLLAVSTHQQQQQQQKTIISEEVLQSVSAYVKHKLSWRPDDYPSRAGPYRLRQQCHPLEGERFTNSTIRQQRKFIHARYAVIEKAISRCARPRYFPRTLSVNQISWKSRPKSDKNNMNNRNGAGGMQNFSSNMHANGTSFESHGWSGTHLVNDSSAAPTPTPGASGAANLSASSEVVHKYLIFAILLPQHPFSSEMMESIKVVAPAYPEVSIVIGSAYEFRDFCGHYNVRSFPKLLFFHKGLLKHKYKGKFNPWALAYQLSKWTNALPVVAPDPGLPYRWIIESDETRGGLLSRLGIHVQSYVNRSATLNWPPYSPPPSPNRTTMPAVQALLDRIEQYAFMMTARSFEPFAGTSESLASQDINVTIFAGVFVLCRGAYYLYKFWYRPVA